MLRQPSHLALACQDPHQHVEILEFETAIVNAVSENRGFSWQVQIVGQVLLSPADAPYPVAFFPGKSAGVGAVAPISLAAWESAAFYFLLV